MVVTSWVRTLDIKRICIFDDDVYKDEFMQQIFMMAKPDGIKLEFFDLETAARQWPNGYFEEAPNEHELILLKNIYCLDKITKLGLYFPKVTIGNMESAPKKKCINRVFFMDENDARILDGIAVETVLTLQELPHFMAAPWSSVRAKHFKKLV